MSSENLTTLMNITKHLIMMLKVNSFVFNMFFFKKKSKETKEYFEPYSILL